MSTGQEGPMRSGLDGGLRSTEKERRPALRFVAAGVGAALLAWIALLLGHTPGAESVIGPRSQYRPIRLDSSAVLSGDLIFRRGRSLISRAVLSVDGSSDFSHVGIAVRAKDQILVVHATPPEGTFSGGVISEPLDSFLLPEAASTAAVFRLRSSDAAARAALKAVGYARAHAPFDSDFDLSTPEALYCTELVWRAYLESGVDLAGRSFNERYLLPSRLLASPEVYLITQSIQEEVH